MISFNRESTNARIKNWSNIFRTENFHEQLSNSIQTNNLDLKKDNALVNEVTKEVQTILEENKINL